MAAASTDQGGQASDFVGTWHPGMEAMMTAQNVGQHVYMAKIALAATGIGNAAGRHG